MPHLGQCDAIATGRYISPGTYTGTGGCMLRTFAIVIAGVGIFASLPLTNAWACDDDRYPCPIRSEALIQETVQAPDQLAPDQPQKKSAQPQKQAKQPAPTTGSPNWSPRSVIGWSRYSIPAAPPSRPSLPQPPTSFATTFAGSPGGAGA